MLQIGRNLVDEPYGGLAGKKYLIMDRHTKYSQRFRAFLEEGGTKVIRLPPRSPNLNAFAERFIRSVKEECLGRMIFIGQASLRRAIAEYMAHFHEERNHQGLGNRLIRRKQVIAANDAAIHRVFQHRDLGARFRGRNGRAQSCVAAADYDDISPATCAFSAPWCIGRGCGTR